MVKREVNFPKIPRSRMYSVLAGQDPRDKLSNLVQGPSKPFNITMNDLSRRSSEFSQRLSEATGLSGLEAAIINNRNHEHYDRGLRAAQKLLARSYSENKVIPYENAKKELSRPENDAYQWVVASHNGRVVATVVYDVWNVPRTPLDQKLVADGKNQYTALFYATASSKKYEPLLKAMIEEAIKRAQTYSKKHNKRNVGILTDDIKHPNAIYELAEKHGGGILGQLGVPTLAEIKDYRKNFTIDGKETLVEVPFNGEWTKSMARRVVGSYLDEGYNKKAKDEEGYRPLTQSTGFRKFDRGLMKAPGRYAPLEKAA